MHLLLRDIILPSYMSGLHLPVLAGDDDGLNPDCGATQHGQWTSSGATSVGNMRKARVLIASDIGRALLLAAIPLAAYLDMLVIGHLYIVAFLVGILTVSFEVAHLSLLPTLVPADRLIDGNSKLEVSRSVAMVAGPGFAGLLVHLVTAPVAIVVDALSFLGSALLLQRIHTPEVATATRDARLSILDDVADGLRVVWRQPLLRSMALSLCVFNLFYSMVGAIHVLFVVRELHLTPGVLGLIYAAGSLGFPLGAVFAGRAARRWGVGPTIVWGAGLSDAAFLLIPLAGGGPASAAAILITAQVLATLAGPMTAVNQLSLRQTITPAHILGRVNATMRVIGLGAAPLGALLAGGLGELLGLRPTLAIGALGLQLGFLVLLISPLRLLRAVSALPTAEAAGT